LCPLARDVAARQEWSIATGGACLIGGILETVGMGNRAILDFIRKKKR
jgi:hypothetical protein